MDECIGVISKMGRLQDMEDLLLGMMRILGMSTKGGGSMVTFKEKASSSGKMDSNT